MGAVAYPSRARRARRARLGLLGLLVLAAGLTAGLLFAKYRLENFRDGIQARIEAQMGARLRAERVVVEGWQGLRIDGFRAFYETAAGPSIRIDAPAVRLRLNPLALADGVLQLERIDVSGAAIVLTRPTDAPWLPPESGGTAGLPLELPDTAFRLFGEDCTLEVHNVVGRTQLALYNTTLDIARLPDAAALSAEIVGSLDADAGKTVRANVRFASAEDFDARFSAAQIDASDVNVFLPASQQFIETGRATPSVRIARQPERSITVSVEAPFADLAVRGQPDWLPAASGRLDILARYDVARKQLFFSAAQVDAQPVGGRLEGSIGFADLPPTLDLRLETDNAPVAEALQDVITAQAADFGEASLRLADDVALGVHLTGTTEAPDFYLTGQAGAADFTFRPANPQWPSVTVGLERLDVAYASDTEEPQLRVTIADGTLRHAPSGMTIDKLSGTLALRDGVLDAAPVAGELDGQPVVARFAYTLAERTALFSVAGAVPSLESTALYEGIPRATLEGAADFRAEGTWNDGRLAMDAAVDLTQARLRYEWWLDKPRGMGAAIQALNVTGAPGEALRATGTLALGASTGSLEIELSPDGDSVRPRFARVRSEHLDLESLVRALDIAYVGEGTPAHDAYLNWEPHPEDPEGFVLKLGGVGAMAEAEAPEVEPPIVLQDYRVDMVQETIADGRTGALAVSAARAELPPLDAPWLVPLELLADPVRLERYPSLGRAWTYDLQTAELRMPPWSGRNFTGSAFNDGVEAGLSQFTAEVGEGTITGSFREELATNRINVAADWDGIPASMLLEHLEFPPLLEGQTTGNFRYTLDLDDPNTLSGEGSFIIRDGQFSADFLARQLETRLAADVGAMPPSRAFQVVRGRVLLDGDTVQTPEFAIEAEGIEISGGGTWVLDGDVDYTVTVTLAPEVAQRIDVLHDYFNLEGHRLTQNQLQLTFRIEGPLFRPSGQVAGLPPAGVTLVSGAAEVLREGIDMIDTPRQILVDLFKIGGGIAGGASTP